MHRFVLFCLLVQCVLAHRHYCEVHKGPCRRHHVNYHRQMGDRSGITFHQLSWDVISVDRRAQSICSSNDKHLSETFLSTYYRLGVFLADFTEDDITIKIKHRVLFVQATKPGVKVFSEIKILPEFVTPGDATWNFQQGLLVIEMSYNAPLGTDVVKVCNKVINETLIEVPKGPSRQRFEVSTPITDYIDLNIVQ